MGLSQSSILRIWRAGLKPEPSIKISPDPQFVEKVRDLAGLYLNPPDAAVVLCVDHKSQIQALDPAAYARNTTASPTTRYGTTNLHAALDTASGRVITSMTRRNRTQEFQAFLSSTAKSHQNSTSTSCWTTRRPTKPNPYSAGCNAIHGSRSILRVVDEPRRAMVLRTHHQTDTPGHPPLGTGTHRRYQPMDPTLEPKPQTVHLAQNRRPNLRQPHQLSTTNPPQDTRSCRRRR